MKLTPPSHESEKHKDSNHTTSILPSRASTSSEAPPAGPPTRSLDSLANQIRVDAADDPVQYLLRSDTVHDGE